MTRVGLILSLLMFVPILAPLFGADSRWLVDGMRAGMAYAGPWAWLAYVLMFVGLVVVQIPPVALVIAAPTLFPLPEAWCLGAVASNLAVAANFALVRKFGGQPLAKSDKPFIQRLFAQLERHPVRTVLVLRLLTFVLPPVTSALALTQLRERDHALGSALGILPPLTVLVMASATLLHLGR